MRNPLLALMVPFVLPMLFACVSPSNDGESTTPLATSLQVPAEVLAGEEVPVTFTFENRTDQAGQVLKWNTPLEGLYNRFFLVTRDGVELPYQGPMAKRMPPTAESYALVPAHGQLSAVVNLGDVYDVSVPGVYTVQFRGNIHDFVYGEGEVPPSTGRKRVQVPSGVVTFQVVDR